MEDLKLPLRTAHEHRQRKKTGFDEDFALFNFTVHGPTMRGGR